MTSRVREIFQQVMIENISMANTSQRLKIVTDLFTELGKTELHTYFTPQGVDELASIVFSDTGIRDFVFSVSAAYRLELALQDTPGSMDLVVDQMVRAIYSEGPNPDRVPGRSGVGEFYVAKQSSEKSRKELLYANEWLPICVMIRANLMLLTAQIFDIASPTEPTQATPNARQSQGKIPA